ncbi:uncharacterized protein LOC124393543 [Silurus meridionalis]|uniref:uncharacterized protein LOC124393543 n=1 Tax=Silurus meridionalis TaxID=175797 RepID=UPI001EEA6DE6|nr:uncharacterized protein LOC124393543 [Silurus meridionalis]
MDQAVVERDWKFSSCARFIQLLTRELGILKADLHHLSPASESTVPHQSFLESSAPPQDLQELSALLQALQDGSAPPQVLQGISTLLQVLQDGSAPPQDLQELSALLQALQDGSAPPQVLQESSALLQFSTESSALSRSSRRAQLHSRSSSRAQLCSRSSRRASFRSSVLRRAPLCSSVPRRAPLRSSVRRGLRSAPGLQVGLRSVPGTPLWPLSHSSSPRGESFCLGSFPAFLGLNYISHAQRNIHIHALRKELRGFTSPQPSVFPVETAPTWGNVTSGGGLVMPETIQSKVYVLVLIIC